MKRKIIAIDEKKCNGCGLCIPNCAEGALQIIDGKARLISDLFCDGLGACIGYCPEHAISIVEREAEPYDEVRVMEENIIPAGKNTILAHLKHLNDHNEDQYLAQAMNTLKKHNIDIDFEKEILNQSSCQTQVGSGCPGSKAMSFEKKHQTPSSNLLSSESELTHWPIQLHLAMPTASYFQKADVLLAADCTAFSMGDFHQNWLKGKSLVIACPKLDSNKEIYEEKVTIMMNQAKINTLTLLIMEVPCCGGLLQIVSNALKKTTRKVPVKLVKVSLKGEILSEDWI